MNGLTATIVILSTTLFLASCETAPFSTASSASSTKPDDTKTPPWGRLLIIDGTTYSEEDLGEFISWRCKDFSRDSGTLVEVGSFPHPDFADTGFILYDGSNAGESTSYQRRGINQRWDWGPSGADFSFVIKPDGTGLFYDFSTAKDGMKSKADDVYKCSK